MPSVAALLAAFAMSVGTSLAAVQLPVEVTAIDTAPVTKFIALNVPAGGNAATSLYLQIHNLRFGGQISVKVNSANWVTLYNHTVTVLEPELSQGAIGGINRTIRLTIPLSLGQVNSGQSNTVSFRLNGTDGVVSSMRVVDVDFLDSTGARLLAAGELTQENPNTWTPPGNAADITAGASLWSTAALYNDPLRQNPINAKCASCHFLDGSDLKYFNYSNESIASRARFHGLTPAQGNQIASYIRSLTKPNPGRPWNPPFQPGPGLDPQPTDSAATKTLKAQSWLAGAGLSAVSSDDAAMLAAVFPNGTSRGAIAKVIEHEGNFSLREIPIPFQFADWNSWLPEYAPEDMWPTAAYYNQPYTFYNTLRNMLTTQGTANLTNAGTLSATFGQFNQDLNNWYGDFRLPDHNLANEYPTSLARNPWLTREEVIRSLVHWMTIKTLEVVRDFNVEDKADAVAPMQAAGNPKYDPDLLAIPTNFRLGTVFSFAPHIISDTWDSFNHQPVSIGKMESDQWYHLALLLNSGSRKISNQNVPLDWDYQLIHLEEAAYRTGRRPYGIQFLITHLKMYQSRDNGSGINAFGFTPRVLHPWRFYSDEYQAHTLHQDFFESVEPGLWRKLFEEFTYEWMDVVESYDLNDQAALNVLGLPYVPRSFNRHELEPTTYTPQAWPGGNALYFQHPNEVYADLMYRLIPLLPKRGVDEMLIQDLIRWSKRAWPLCNWDSLVTRKALYSEDFETGSGFTAVSTAALAPVAIKDANYVNTNSIGLKNGGGAYVGTRTLTTNAIRLGTNSTINVPLNGETRLKVMARVAFKDTDGVDPGAVNFKMQFRFNGTATSTYDSENVVTLDPALFGVKFQTYESYINVPSGATNLTWFSVWWQRVGGTGSGTVYIDNIQVLPASTVLDITATAKPATPSVVAQDEERLHVSWTANSVADGVSGYNVYRWRTSDAMSAKVKLNVGLVDNPYISFEDYTVPAGVSHSYHITAVDAAGNESVPSNTKTGTLPNTDVPVLNGSLSGFNGSGYLELRWLGSNAWDIAGYEVYRKASGEAGFTLLPLVADPADPIFFSDPSALQGISYDYYVRAFDLLGNQSAPTLTLSLQAQTGVTYVSLWKKQFQGTYGWDTTNLTATSDAADFDRDGVSNLWEYIQGKNPAISDSSATSGPKATIANVGASNYLELTYERQSSLPPGVVIKVQFSNDLATWPVQAVVEGAAVGAGISVTTGSVSNGRRTITVRQSAPIGSGAYRFMRLSAEQVAP